MVEELNASLNSNSDNLITGEATTATAATDSSKSRWTD